MPKEIENKRLRKILKRSQHLLCDNIYLLHSQHLLCDRIVIQSYYKILYIQQIKYFKKLYCHHIVDFHRS